MFKADGIYYLMFSNKTSWERNDNYYFTAHNLHGPWTYQGLFCPKGSLTYNSQCSFVFEYQGEQGKYRSIWATDGRIPDRHRRQRW